MTTKRMIAIAVTSALLTTTSIADIITPRDILEKVEATYKAMDTYKAEGTITSDIDTGGMKVNTATSFSIFSILLKQPNLCLISCTQKNMPIPGMVQPGAAWSDGTQP